MPTSYQPGEIEGVIIRRLQRYEDARGWLAEVFRQDELPAELWPVMAYVSVTRPGVARGPHEHRHQTDMFCFLGPGTFEVRLWDGRGDSPTYGCSMTLRAGEDDPKVVVILSGVVHGYRNIGSVEALVINLPNRLYRGEGRKEPVDEVWYEDDTGSPFRI